MEDSKAEPNAETYTAMESAKNGEDLYGPFSTVEELMAALNED